MKRGDRIVAEVTQLSAKGDGLAQVEGREVAMRRAVPGDRVEAVLRKKRKGRFEADVEQFLQLGVERREPDCPHFGDCGGCRWQDLRYADQLVLKESMVQAALQSKGIEVEVTEPIAGCPTPLYYRNKMEFSFGTDREGELQLGLHLRGRFNRVFDVRNCRLQSPASNRIVETVRRQAIESGISVYDLKRHQGILRFLVIRESKKGEGLMVNLVVSEYPCEAVTHLAERVLEEVKEISTWIVSLHQGKAQVAIGQEEFLLKGEGSIVEECNGVEYEISSRSFFQTNTLQAELLYGKVLDWAGDLEGKEVLDLFCGAGGMSFHLARHARSVLGIEIVEDAVADARKNAERNGIANCSFIAGPVEGILEELRERRFDLIVADPPRAGIHRKALSVLADIAIPRLIYVSCNPVTLAEDLAVLLEAGWRLDRLQAVDMFPQTPHCEVVALLIREDR